MWCLEKWLHFHYWILLVFHYWPQKKGCFLLCHNWHTAAVDIWQIMPKTLMMGDDSDESLPLDEQAWKLKARIISDILLLHCRKGHKELAGYFFGKKNRRQLSKPKMTETRIDILPKRKLLRDVSSLHCRRLFYPKRYVCISIPSKKNEIRDW